MRSAEWVERGTFGGSQRRGDEVAAVIEGLCGHAGACRQALVGSARERRRAADRRASPTSLRGSWSPASARGCGSTTVSQFLDLVDPDRGQHRERAQAYEEERKRAEALAEIDRAKTRILLQCQP